MPIPADRFAIEDRGDATPLGKFVALPEAIPSRLIGQVVPSFQLVGEQKVPISREEGQPDAAIQPYAHTGAASERRHDSLHVIPAY